MEALTKRQQELLDFIRKCEEKDGVIPTMREIAAHFGFRSPRTVTDHVVALRRKGALVEAPPGRSRARALRVLPAAHTCSGLKMPNTEG